MKLECNSRGLLEMFEILQQPAQMCNTYRLPKIHELKAGEYDISDANQLFPASLFECIYQTDLILINLIDANTGRVTGILGDKRMEDETVGETIFRIVEDYQNRHHMTAIAGIILRYNNSDERKYLKYIPFAVVES